MAPEVGRDGQFTGAATCGGVIEASTGWRPSCAFLDDTADALAELMRRDESGVFQIEGNTAGMSFFEIASALGGMAGRNRTVLPSESPVRDNRMQDERIRVKQVAERLKARV